MWRANLVNALGDNDKRSTDKKQPDHQCSKRFCFTVTIGMIFVRRTVIFRIICRGSSELFVVDSAESDDCQSSTTAGRQIAEKKQRHLLMKMTNFPRLPFRIDVSDKTDLV
jgi:hypothetical protein